MDVWHNGRNVDSVYLQNNNGGSELTGQFYYCPFLDGIGNYTLGTTQVDAWDANYNETTFVDHSHGTMKIKQDTRARLTTPRSHPRRIYVAPQYYAIGHGWHRYPGNVRANLQRQHKHPSATTPWRRIAVQHTGPLGRAVFQLSQHPAHHYRYRVTSGPTARSWWFISRVVIK